MYIEISRLYSTLRDKFYQQTANLIFHLIVNKDERSYDHFRVDVSSAL